MLDVRDCLKPAIDSVGMKYFYVAEKAGITGQKLSDIMAKRRRLEANELINICNVIKITPNDLLGYGIENEKEV